MAVVTGGVLGLYFTSVCTVIFPFLAITQRKKLDYPNNQKIVSFIKGLAIHGLSIGPHICSKSQSRCALVTLGRGDADIKVEGPNIS